MANLAGAMFSSYTSTGSFSRSAVSADIGARSNLAGGITGASLRPVSLCNHLNHQNNHLRRRYAPLAPP